MGVEQDFEFFKLRKGAKTFISKVFSFGGKSTEPLRNVRMVFEGSDSVHVGEIQGAICLRASGNVRKTQVTALVSQDDKRIRRLSLQTFKTRKGEWGEALEKDEFTFRGDEFERLLGFLSQIEFVNLSNQDTFQIEDISRGAGPKAIIDASDRPILERIRTLSKDERLKLVSALASSLTSEEVNIVLGRRQGLEEYEAQVVRTDWTETNWQDFFERNEWVFGYGLDYRVMRQFDREMTVGGGGVDNRNKPVVDFLMTFKDYTVLVEIKKPNTPIFRASRGGRAGTWEFSPDFMNAVSQVIEQKAEWLAYAQSGEHFDKAGTSTLEARTRNARTILVIGSREEFRKSGNARDARVMSDTFELLRRETRNIDIVTFDELLERARFITRSQ